MPKKARENISDRNRNRAAWCRQLAKGVGDRRFAEKLNALADEFEGHAGRPIGWRNDLNPHD